MISNQEFYQNVPLGILVIKRDRMDSSVLFHNDVMASMLSADCNTLIGQKIETIWPGADIAEFLKELHKPNPPQHYTLSITGEDESASKWVKVSIVADSYNGESCYTLWVTDISSNKKAEEQLKQAVAKADASAEIKSNFLATMSHEMRTPMQSIFGFLELIAEEKPDEKIMSMIKTARFSASGLLEMLDDILDIAKMDADQMQLDTFEVPVRTLVRGILEALSVKLHGNKVALIDEIGDDVPYVVVGDPMRLRQIIMNLTGNAIKFTQDGIVTVRVSTQAQHIPPSTHGLALRFEIIDTGIGLSEEAQAKLFSPFVQADSSTSRKFGGTGLGLSICKKLVELMGGKIGVSSKEGEGSNFWFEIPTEAVDIDANTISEFPNLDGVTILAVEDHPQGGQEIKRSLESMGAEVHLCDTYAEGLSLVKRRPYDVGIIDQGLPDGLGLDLIKEITEIRPFMGLVMYTVRDDVGLQHSLNSLGVKYISKPASRIGLAEEVLNAIQVNRPEVTTGNKKLLIAEDTESVRDILGRQLEKLGVKADFAENGLEAKQALESGDYGILFSDLHMPEMDGYQLIDIIRENEKQSTEPPMPVIVLTADVQMAQRNEYLKYGFDECLLKPISLGQLRRLLIRWGLISDETDYSKPAQAPAEQQPPAEQQEDALSPASSTLQDNTSQTSAEKPSESKEPSVSKDLIKAQMGSLDENSVKMMNMFVEMTAPIIDKIEYAASNENYPELRELAHSLKGGARSACCPRLGDIASTLQDEAEASRTSAIELVADVRNEFENVKKEISCLQPE